MTRAEYIRALNASAREISRARDSRDESRWLASALDWDRRLSQIPLDNLD